jgi:hypothetical protein
MTFSYKQGIPFATDNPSDDQPNMEINNDSNYGIWQVDHHGFSPDVFGGQHIQQTYPGFASPSTPSASTGASVAYPAAGIDQNTTAQYYFQNVNATFPLSAIKAFGVFTPLSVSGDITPSNGFNIDGFIVQTTVFGSRTTWQITLNTGAITSVNVAIFVLASGTNSGGGTVNPVNLSWSLSSNVLTIAGNTSQKINFAILQI